MPAFALTLSNGLVVRVASEAEAKAAEKATAETSSSSSSSTKTTTADDGGGGEKKDVAAADAVTPEQQGPVHREAHLWLYV